MFKLVKQTLIVIAILGGLGLGIFAALVLEPASKLRTQQAQQAVNQTRIDQAEITMEKLVTGKPVEFMEAQYVIGRLGGLRESQAVSIAKRTGLSVNEVLRRAYDLNHMMVTYNDTATSPSAEKR